MRRDGRRSVRDPMAGVHRRKRDVKPSTAIGDSELMSLSEAQHPRSPSTHRGRYRSTRSLISNYKTSTSCITCDVRIAEHGARSSLLESDNADSIISVASADLQSTGVAYTGPHNDTPSVRINYRRSSRHMCNLNTPSCMR